jgi:hypothetical protein
MPTDHATPSAASVARLAIDLDELAQQLEIATPPKAELFTLAAAAFHLSLSLDRLDDILYQADKLDQRAPAPPSRKADAREIPAAPATTRTRHTRRPVTASGRTSRTYDAQSLLQPTA